MLRFPYELLNPQARADSRPHCSIVDLSSNVTLGKFPSHSTTMIESMADNESAKTLPDIEMRDVSDTALSARKVPLVMHGTRKQHDRDQFCGNNRQHRVT
jgi:hypothetical protein